MVIDKTTSDPLDVSALYERLREPIKETFREKAFTIEGDILSVNSYYDNLSRENLYLSVCSKDEFRSSTITVFVPADVVDSCNFYIGTDTQVVINGSITVGYNGLQLRAKSITLAGIGKLNTQIQAWKNENKDLLSRTKKSLPVLVSSIAVISTKTALGYGDFARHLKYGKVQLFDAKMQGNQTAKEIAQQISLIQNSGEFDCIAIVRGGGSKIDLHEFNKPELLEAIASSTIPILTAIGHEGDELLCDLAADQAFSTPTELAMFLSNRTETLLKYIRFQQREIVTNYQNIRNQEEEAKHNKHLLFGSIAAIILLIVMYLLNKG